jgi:hypothetical protein
MEMRSYIEISVYTQWANNVQGQRLAIVFYSRAELASFEMTAGRRLTRKYLPL